MTEKNAFENSESQDYFELWKFPDFDDQNSINESEPDDFVHDEPPESIATEESIELIHLKETLQEKIVMYERLNQQLHEKINQIDQALLEHMIQCVKNVTKKIISQAFEQDEGVMNNMLRDILEKIKDHKTCRVLLSSEDFDHLNHEVFAEYDNLRVLFEVDQSLKRGDFKILTPISEISAIIEDRLNIFFKNFL